MSANSKPPLYKIVMLGDSGVGKTSLVARLTNPIAPTLDLDMSATVGITFDTQMLNTPHGKMNAQVWDATGRESLMPILLPTYLRGAKGVMLVYDATSRESLESLRGRWMAQLDEHIASPDDELVKLIVGNKCDVGDSSRGGTREEAEAFCAEFGMEHLETSAASGANVREAFERLITIVHKKNLNLVAGGGSNMAPLLKLVEGDVKATATAEVYHETEVASSSSWTDILSNTTTQNEAAPSSNAEDEDRDEPRVLGKLIVDVAEYIEANPQRGRWFDLPGSYLDARGEEDCDVSVLTLDPALHDEEHFDEQAGEDAEPYTNKPHEEEGLLFTDTLPEVATNGDDLLRTSNATRHNVSKDGAQPRSVSPQAMFCSTTKSGHPDQVSRALEAETYERGAPSSVQSYNQPVTLRSFDEETEHSTAVATAVASVDCSMSTLTADERSLLIKRGRCPTCGIQTHKRSGLLKKSYHRPISNENVLSGRCLMCNPINIVNAVGVAAVPCENLADGGCFGAPPANSDSPSSQYEGSKVESSKLGSAVDAIDAVNLPNPAPSAPPLCLDTPSKYPASPCSEAKGQVEHAIGAIDAVSLPTPPPSAPPQCIIPLAQSSSKIYISSSESRDEVKHWLTSHLRPLRDEDVEKYCDCLIADGFDSLSMLEVVVESDLAFMKKAHRRFLVNRLQLSSSSPRLFMTGAASEHFPRADKSEASLDLETERSSFVGERPAAIDANDNVSREPENTKSSAPIPSRPPQMEDIPDLLKTMTTEKGDMSAAATKRIYELCDVGHKRNRVPMVCSGNYDVLAPLAQCLTQESGEGRHLACLALINLSIPTENKRVMALGPSSSAIISGFCKVIAAGKPESYLCCICLVNISSFEASITTMLQHSPVPEGCEPVPPLDNPESLLRILERLLKQYPAAYSRLRSGKSEGVRWACGLIKNLAKSEENAVLFGETDIPKCIVANVRNSTVPPGQWTTNSLEEFSLSIILNLAKWPGSRQALVDAGAIGVVRPIMATCILVDAFGASQVQKMSGSDAPSALCRVSSKGKQKKVLRQQSPSFASEGLPPRHPDSPTSTASLHEQPCHAPETVAAGNDFDENFPTATVLSNDMFRLCLRSNDFSDDGIVFRETSQSPQGLPLRYLRSAKSAASLLERPRHAPEAVIKCNDFDEKFPAAAVLSNETFQLFLRSQMLATSGPIQVDFECTNDRS